ncbi:MAG: putative transport system permease protein, partial [Clostridiales bacterium]|nr:putative transport system permease protein [Clostridiales bacterium]
SDFVQLQVGDTFTFKMAHGEDTVYVAGVLSNSSFVSEEGKQTVVCSEQTFQDLTGEQGYSVIDIQLARNASEDTVTQLRGITSSEEIFQINERSMQEPKQHTTPLHCLFMAFL